ncbi:MAG: dTMP kinase [Pseudomonadota bacterium]
MTGLFITVEGGEGAGKSTALTHLERLLEQHEAIVVCTREPGGTQLGEGLRALLLSDQYGDVMPLSELLMMFAARAQHLHEVIGPALDRGETVLCDRFTDASFAYQGAGRGLGEKPVAMLETLTQGALRPDLVILLDLPPEQGIERARGRGGLDRFEREELEFFERVRSAYLSRAQSEPDRYRIVDASVDKDAVCEQLSQCILDFYRTRRARVRG